MLGNLDLASSIERVLRWFKYLETRISGASDLNIFRSFRISPVWLVVFLVMTGIGLYWGFPQKFMMAFTAIPFIAIISLGLGDILRLKVRLREEINALKVFSSNAHRLINDESNNSERDILDLVPATTLQPTVHAKELIESVAKANLNILSAPVESMLHTPRRELETRLVSALQYGAISTRLGILGTFVGLVVAIDGLGQSFEYLTLPGSTLEDRGSLSTTLESLSFAFVTSIWGLIGSFVISLICRDFRSRLEEFYHAFGDAFSYGRELAYRLALSDASIHQSLVDVGRDLRSVDRRLAEHGEAVRLGLEDQSHIVLRQAEFLKETALGLSQGREHWQSAVSDLEKAASTMDQSVLAAMRSFESCVGETKSAFENGYRDVAQIIDEEMTKLRQATKRLELSAVAINKNDGEAVIIQTLRELAENLEAIRRNSETQQGQLGDVSEQKLAEISKSMSHSVATQNEILSAIQRQTSALEINQKTIIASISTGLSDAVSNLPSPTVKAKRSIGALLFNFILLSSLLLVIEVEIINDPLELRPHLRHVIDPLRGMFG